uniref:Uncharacterized protein n=1 Tax=Hemiselmis andersenii TaxID=464988 RepID=A0A7S0U6Z6_HEMAN
MFALPLPAVASGSCSSSLGKSPQNSELTGEEWNARSRGGFFPHVTEEKESALSDTGRHARAVCSKVRFCWIGKGGAGGPEDLRKRRASSAPRTRDRGASCSARLLRRARKESRGGRGGLTGKWAE